MNKLKILAWLLLFLLNFSLIGMIPLGYATLYLMVNSEVTWFYLLCFFSSIYVTFAVFLLDIKVKREGLNYLLSIFYWRD